MASNEIVFLDGPRKGRPMAVGGKNDGDAYGDTVRVAYVEDGVTKIALYRKVTKMRPGGIVTLSNEYKYVRDV